VERLGLIILAENNMTSLLNRFRLFLTKLIAIILLLLIGGCVMSADIELNWEWPADRKIEQRILIKIDKVKAQGSGFFGIKASPSFAASVPDPIIVRGTVQGDDKLITGKTISVVVPKLEIESLAAGGYAVLGVVETKVCICIIPVESSDVDVASINCP
jgi:hypothetical protein